MPTTGFEPVISCIWSDCSVPKVPKLWTVQVDTMSITFKNGPLPASFSLCSSFQQFSENMLIMTGFEQRTSALEVTMLSTEPQPLPFYPINEFVKVLKENHICSNVPFARDQWPFFASSIMTLDSFVLIKSKHIVHMYIEIKQIIWTSIKRYEAINRCREKIKIKIWPRRNF